MLPFIPLGHTTKEYDEFYTKWNAYMNNFLFPQDERSRHEPVSFEGANTPRIWDPIKERLKEFLSETEFDLWIKPLVVDESIPGEITLYVPNQVFLQGFNVIVFHQVEHCKNLFGLEGIKIFTKLIEEMPSKEKEIESSKKINSNQINQSSNTKVESLEHDRDMNNKSSSMLEPRFTFSTFVKGPSNQFAVASCTNVAENPGKTYNPLFIYGNTGLGKTHLMHAVGNRVLMDDPSLNVVYVRAENFMNEMIHCIRHDKMSDFRRKYRHCDVLMVDDIQFISGNRKMTQEEFFHTFNSLYEAKKQIIITSDLYPQDIPDIEERLRNRFQWGLIADIAPPDVEHRMAILFGKAEQLGINLDKDVAEYISNHAKKNVRELEGALNRIHAFSTLTGRKIDRALALETFQNVLGEPPKRITIETIQKTVADHFKLKISDLKSKRRHRTFTYPRQIAMYLSKEVTKSSFPQIGEAFGGKDHTTVMHAVKKIAKDKEVDQDLKSHLSVLERQIEQLG